MPVQNVRAASRDKITQDHAERSNDEEIVSALNGMQQAFVESTLMLSAEDFLPKQAELHPLVVIRQQVDALLSALQQPGARGDFAIVSTIYHQPQRINRIDAMGASITHGDVRLYILALCQSLLVPIASSHGVSLAALHWQYAQLKAQACARQDHHRRLVTTSARQRRQGWARRTGGGRYGEGLFGNWRDESPRTGGTRGRPVSIDHASLAAQSGLGSQNHQVIAGSHGLESEYRWQIPIEIMHTIINSFHMQEPPRDSNTAYRTSAGTTALVNNLYSILRHGQVDVVRRPWQAMQAMLLSAGRLEQGGRRARAVGLCSPDDADQQTVPWRPLGHILDHVASLMASMGRYCPIESERERSYQWRTESRRDALRSTASDSDAVSYDVLLTRLNVHRWLIKNLLDGIDGIRHENRQVSSSHNQQPRGLARAVMRACAHGAGYDDGPDTAAPRASHVHNAISREDACGIH